VQLKEQTAEEWRSAVAARLNAVPNLRIVKLVYFRSFLELVPTAALSVLEIVYEDEKQYYLWVKLAHVDTQANIVIIQAGTLLPHVVGSITVDLTEKVTYRLLLIDTVAIDHRVAEKEDIPRLQSVRIAETIGVCTVSPPETIEKGVRLEARLHDCRSRKRLTIVKTVGQPIVLGKSQVLQLTAENLGPHAQSDLEQEHAD
jgi:hypothetical protein